MNAEKVKAALQELEKIQAHFNAGSIRFEECEKVKENLIGALQGEDHGRDTETRID